MSSRSRHAADPPILIVEDKDSLRTMLRLALEAQGHVVVEARDQKEAEAALLAVHPAVVLSDLRLTEGEAFAARGQGADPQLPKLDDRRQHPDAVNAMSADFCRSIPSSAGIRMGQRARGNRPRKS